MVVTPETFLTLATPLEVAELSGHPVEVAATGQTTHCPTCNSVLWLARDSFLCSNPQCRFTAGGVLDFLAAIHAFDYQLACQSMRDLFPARFSHQALPDSMLDHQAGRLARRDRDLLECFLKAGRAVRSNETMMIRSYYQQLRIDERVLDRSAIAMGGAELATLMEELARNHQAEPKLRDRAYLVIPYWSNYHTLDSILFVNPHSQHTVGVQLGRTKFAYSGLWTWRGSQVPVMLMRDPLEAMHCGGGAEAYLGVTLNHRTLPHQALPCRRVFVVGRAGDLTTAASFERHNPGTHFCTEGSRPESATDWETCLFRCLQHSLAEQQLSTQTYAILDAVRLSGGQLRELQTRADQAGLPSLSRELMRLSQSPIIYETRQLTIRQLPEGYCATFAQAEHPEMLSNFTLTFRHSTSFQERQALFFNATMHFMGREYDLMIAQADMTNLRKLIDEAQRVVTIRDGARQGIPYLATNPAVKFLQQHWQRELSQLPCLPGIPFLGWNAHRDLFFAPSWQIGMDGISREHRHLHPDITMLGSFCQEPVADVELSGLKLPTELCDLISIILGYLVRGRLQYPLRPIEILQDSNSSRILAALFRAFGQQHPIANPTFLKGLQSFPSYTYYILSRPQVESLSCPILCCSPSEHAMSLRQVPSDDDLDLATKVLAKLAFRTIETLLGHPDLKFNRIPHVSYGSQLCQEGCRWIRQHLGLPDWALGRQPLHHTQAAIAAIPPKKIGDVVRYVAGQDPRALLRRDRLTGNLTDLELEFRWMDDTLREENGCFSLSYPNVARLLQCYHGQFIAIPAPDENWLPE